MDVTFYVQSNKNLQAKGIVKLDSVPPFLPSRGSTLQLEIMCGGVRVSCFFTITNELHTWGAKGFGYALYAKASFDEVKRLILVAEWDLLDGMNDLSKDQRELVECRMGLCGHSEHAV